MTKENFHKLFVQEIKDIYNSENQIVQALPKLAKAASDPELKQAFQHHLAETKNQIKRLQKILTKLGESPSRVKCEGMKGILDEGKEILATKFGVNSTAVKDAAIIGAAQKVEHYEIASYGTVRSYASLLGLREIARLLQESLDEEANANETLNKIAQGGFFTRGINVKASKENEPEVERQAPKRTVTKTARKRKTTSRTKSRSRTRAR